MSFIAVSEIMDFVLALAQSSCLGRLCQWIHCSLVGWLAGLVLLQHGGIACNAERCNSYGNSVRQSVTRWYSNQMNENRIMRSSLWGSKNTSFLIPTMVGGRRPLPPKICAQSDTPVGLGLGKLPKIMWFNYNIYAMAEAPVYLGFPFNMSATAALSS